MAYQTGWLVEGRIIELKITGLFSARELKDVDEELLPMFRANSGSTIHVLFDLTGMTYSPPLSALRAVQILREPNIGWCVNFGTFNPLFRVMTTPLARLLGIKQRFFSNRDEALRFLQVTDTTLPPLSARQQK